MDTETLSRREKFWVIIGPVSWSLLAAFTSPVIHVYFMSHIEPQIFAIARLLETGLAAIVNCTIQSDRLKELYRRYFPLIVITDIIIFTTTSIVGVDYPVVRFLGFSFLNSVSTCLWFMIMKNIINRIIADGDQRTNFDALEKTLTLSASLIGGICAIIWIDLPVEYCVLIQCLGNTIMGCTDLYAFKILNRAYTTNKADSNNNN